ncbi:MAG: T9SS type A sorting domain-containing protein [Bacteroidales bacterium]|nr:T9SS type A sorting domain-containing protein [Bacteroidales bacterium]
MKKTWTPTNDSGTEGIITLETFVTGESVSTHSPTDIVLVLDVSGSMAYGLKDLGYQTTGLSTEKGAIPGYYVAKYSDNNYRALRYYNNRWQVNANSNQTGNWSNYTPSNYRTIYESRMGALKDAVSAFVDNISNDARLYNVDHRISIVKFAGNRYYPQTDDEAIVDEGDHTYINTYTYNCTEVVINRRPANGDANYIKNQVNALVARGATASDYGMKKARYVLAQIPVSETNRQKVVVMFTDGSPTHGNQFDQTVANTTIGNAYVLKHSGMVNGTNHDFNAKVFTVGVFSTETNDIRTYMNFTSSNYPDAQSMTNGGTVVQDPHFYFTADSPESLENVFTTIAGESGALTMNNQTIVQDEISTVFTLPTGGAGSKITAYAPKFIKIENGEYVFDTLNNQGVLSLDNNGAVNGGIENMLPQECITISADGKTIQFTGFSFTEMWCGYEDNNPHGRKLVMQIPMKIQEGVWGDGIQTNGPMSVLFPNGDVANPIHFECPSANVLGDVWTEKVVTQPSSFDPTKDPIEIGTPEDLAWFISWVNGRANYEVNSGIEPHPQANAILTADIDMSAHNWVPIGSCDVTYEGTFNGNGHVITGLKNNASKFYKINKTVVVYPGMFGRVSGTVHDVFVLDSEFRAKNHDQKTKIHYGIIIDTLMQGGSLYNSEAAGQLITNNEGANNTLVFGGLVGLNDGGTIHSCMSMAQLTGFTMGGAVGENRKEESTGTGSLENSFVNPQYHYIGGQKEHFAGGLVAINYGIIKRIYVRFERENTDIDQSKFGRIIGANYYPWGGDDKVYSPSSCSTVPARDIYISESAGSSIYYYTAPSPKYLYAYQTSLDNVITTNYESMEKKLNSGLPNGYSPWKRTTAGNYSHGAGDINDDYPILSFDYACVGSSDGIALDYSHSLDDMLKRHNEGNLNEYTQLGDNYKKTKHEAIYGGTVNLYKNQHTTQSTNDNVVVYIDEDIALTQSESSSIEAYTCQTLTRPKEYWHTIASSLQKSMIGFNYNTTSQVPFSWDNTNPCNVSISETHDDYNLFPHDLDAIEHIDLFCFYEPEYHWINLKRNSNSHWHMNDTDLPIEYENEDHLIPGKGYLAAIDKQVFIQNRGFLNNGNNGIPVTSTQDVAWAGLLGHNLIGNPYQSYLDFETFAQQNANLWNENGKFANSYAVYDATSDAYLQYMSGASTGSNTASRYINMHQGFFIIKSGTAEEALFTNAMRTMTRGNGFRKDASSFPLINLTVSDERGKNDIAVLELGRSTSEGAEKINVSSGNGTISLRHDGSDYAILFTDMEEGSQPLSFKAKQDGQYTLSWNTANAEFSSLTLVDHITGQQCDMLANNHYDFDATTEQYTSRFKIIIGKNNNDNTTEDNQNFAYIYEGSIFVNGSGFLEVIDPLGRRVYSTSLTNTTSNGVPLPSFAKGLYLLRLTDNNNIKTQKIVF